MSTTPRALYSLPLLGLTCCLSEPPFEESSAHVDAYCSAWVSGWGAIDIENDYLPHVITCEIGRAGPQALRAQAVAARSYLYYHLTRSGYIGDGQSAQVYSCGAQPGPAEYQAVADTAGMVLTYGGGVISSFFVAGSTQSPPACQGGWGGRYPGTENYVTYNEGRTGGDVRSSSIGGAVWENRGCMSQNGAMCLESIGYAWPDILRFYYGADIGIEWSPGWCTGSGPAVEPEPEPEPVPDPPEEWMGNSVVTGTVYDANGPQPLHEDSRVTVYLAGRWAHVGEDRTFRIEGVAEGEFGITAVDNGPISYYEPWEAMVSVGSGETTIDIGMIPY